jgi:hypothetical protein
MMGEHIVSAKTILLLARKAPRAILSSRVVLHIPDRCWAVPAYSRLLIQTISAPI